MQYGVYDTLGYNVQHWAASRLGITYKTKPVEESQRQSYRQKFAHYCRFIIRLLRINTSCIIRNYFTKRQHYICCQLSFSLPPLSIRFRCMTIKCRKIASQHLFSVVYHSLYSPGAINPSTHPTPYYAKTRTPNFSPYQRCHHSPISGCHSFVLFPSYMSASRRGSVERISGLPDAHSRPVGEHSCGDVHRS